MREETNDWDQKIMVRHICEKFHHSYLYVCQCQEKIVLVTVSKCSYHRVGFIL